MEVFVANAERMMTAAAARDDGIHLTFADGRGGVIPYTDLPLIVRRSNLASIHLPNPYELVVTDSRGSRHDIRWDFARRYCDSSYPPVVEAEAEHAVFSLAERVREIRMAAGMTQGQLSLAAGVSRITLVRLESGAQLPRYDTLMAIAEALGRPVASLLVDG